MAFISYAPKESVPDQYIVADSDNIIQIHAVHPQIMKLHYEIYVELMHRKSDWTRVQRELIAIVVSDFNQCHY